MSWVCLNPRWIRAWHKPAWAWSWTELKQPWLQLTGGETLVFAACFEKEPENQLKESGKRSLVRHKVVELLTLLRTINAVVPDTFFFFYTPSPSTPPYLPHLESIKELGEEGKNLSTGNVFTMPGKARGTPFKCLKHPCWIFWGLFLFFGGKFHEPLNRSFTRLAKANPPKCSFSFQACSCVLLLL